jgi:hypothetical protein
LLLWFELHAHGGASVSTRLQALCSSSDPQHDLKDSKQSSNSSDKSNSRDSACTPASTCFGMGLYYLDAALRAAPATHHHQQQKPQKQPPGMPASHKVVISTQVQEQLRLQFNITAGAAPAAPAGPPTNRPDSHAATILYGRHDRGSSSSSSLSCGSSSGGGSKCSYTWSPHGVPRHAMLPRWHFDMLGDEARNSAYDAAIRCGRRLILVYTGLSSVVALQYLAARLRQPNVYYLTHQVQSAASLHGHCSLRCRGTSQCYSAAAV